MIEQINHIAHLWWSGTTAMFWQVGVLIILIGCVDLIIRRWAWPQLRYAMWLMVLIKLILPPTISLSTSITSGLQPLARQIVAKESRRENLSTAAAMILARFENSLAESPVEAVSSGDTFSARQPAAVYIASENAAGEPPDTNHVELAWQVYAMAAWLAGTFILGGWLAVKLLYLRKADRRLAATASLPESFYEAITRCAKSLELRRVPKVVLTRKVACPAVFGIIRPVLLMPVGYLSRMTRRDTEHMLLHELAHIKRGDLWVHGFYMLLQVVYWYNPLLWLVRSQMHHLRELCCDATVARLLKERTSEYRQTLIDVARRFLTKSTEPGLGLLGLFEDSNRLLVRLNWLKKETWRYQKMKKLTIIITIVLMLAFVLPMAQAQDKPSTEESIAVSVQAEEQPSYSNVTSQAGQDEDEPQTKEQLLQARQALQAQLQQLHIERQKLQQQLQALMQIQHVQVQAGQATIKAKEAMLKAKEEKTWAEKAQASAEVVKAEAEAKKWEQWANSWINSDEFKKWQKDMEQWAKEHANAHEQAKSSDDVSTSAHEAHPMPVMPPMPAMPVPVEVVAPAIVVPTPPETPVAVEPLSTQITDVRPVLVSLDSPQDTAVVPEAEPQPMGTGIEAPAAEIAEPALVLPGTPGTTGEQGRKIAIEKDKDDNYVATTEMHFVSKVKPGSPFVVRNNLGNITLRPSKDGTCDVKAVIRAQARTADKAKEMVEQVGMNLQSSDDRYYLQPVKADGGQWSNLSVDFTIAVPVGVRPDIKTDLGNIDLSDLKGEIKAVTNLGNVKAVNTAGNVNLSTDLGNVEFIAPKGLAGGDFKLATNLGDIKFTAPRDISAKLQVQTKMGSIDSDLPLEINKSDMFKRTTEGAIGAGQASIKMATEMGSISLKWQPPSQNEIKL